MSHCSYGCSAGMFMPPPGRGFTASPRACTPKLTTGAAPVGAMSGSTAPRLTTAVARAGEGFPDQKGPLMTTKQAAAVSAAEFVALFEQVKSWGRWGADDQRGA